MYATAAFFLFPVLSFGILMIQGAGFSDFFNAAVLIKKLVNAPATTYFYYAYGLYFNPQIVKMVFFMMLKAIKILWMPFLVLFGFNFISFKYIANKFLKYSVTVLSLIFSIYVVFKTFTVMEKYYHSIFCWIGLACLAILGIFSAY